MAVTRDDVARRAGVSSAVVSYVLNDGPRPVSVDARARVLAAISELGYQRNGAARDLALGRSRSLGLVVPDVGMPYFGRITQTIASRASELGFQLLVGTTGWDLAREQAQLLALAERRVEGLILMSVDPLQDLQSWAALGAPVAIVDRPEFAVDGAATATGHLVWHRHSRIGMIASPLEHVATQRRRSGWRRALIEAGLEHTDDLVQSTDVSLAGGYTATHALLTRRPDLTALFVESDIMAIGALRALRERGVDVGEGFGVASSDATEFAEYAHPTLTALQQATSDVAEAAISAVTAEGASGVHRLDIIGFELIRRESCGCVTFS